MILREIPVATRDQYLEEMNSILLGFSEMTKEMDTKLAEYGAIHNKFTHDIFSLSHATNEKLRLKDELVNLNANTLDHIVDKLNDLRERYVNEAIPNSPETEYESPEMEKLDELTKLVKLSFIEKELKVMKDDELLEYHKEHYLEDSIAKLCEIEYKSRKGYREGNILFTPLPVYGVDDSTTKSINNWIKKIIAMRSVTKDTFVMNSLSSLGVPAPIIKSWSHILEQVEKRNQKREFKVSVAEFLSIQ